VGESEKRTISKNRIRTTGNQTKGRNRKTVLFTKRRMGKEGIGRPHLKIAGRTIGAEFGVSKRGGASEER